MRKLFTSLFAMAITLVVSTIAFALPSATASAATVSRAYALRVYDDTWGGNINQTELVSFDVDKPSAITVEQKFENKKNTCRGIR